MGKTRSCRRTDEENRLHDRAVKLRKMTDEQLCGTIDLKIVDAYNEGFVKGLESAGCPESVLEETSYDVRRFIGLIAELPGIGITTMKKIRDMAKREGYPVS